VEQLLQHNVLLEGDLTRRFHGRDARAQWAV
jgi:hypothetical protein